MENKKKWMTGGLGILGISIFFSLAVMQKKHGSAPAEPETASENIAENDAPNDAEASAPKKSASLSEVSAMDVMCAPVGIAAMPDGSLLVTDTYHKRVWRIKEQISEVYAGADTATGLYGEPIGGYNDAERLSSYFGRPWDVTEFLDGWAVSDTENNVVRLVRGQEVQTLNARAEGEQTAADTGLLFDRPTGLASDAEGSLYISDTGNGAIRKVSPDGALTTEADGLNEPMGLCWKDGALYIAETGANRIVKLEDAEITVVAGNGEEDLIDGPAPEAAFAAPRDVAVGDDGSVYVADTLNSAIRRIQDGQVDTVTVRDMANAGFGLVSPSGLMAQGGKLYICDNFSRKIFILEWK